jgi:hypothetical protein
VDLSGKRKAVESEAQQVQEFIRAREAELARAKDRLQQLIGKIEALVELEKEQEPTDGEGAAPEAAKDEIKDRRQRRS